MIPADPWAGFGPATILRSDALALPIADSSVDLIVTSPPYFALRSYQDGGEHYAGQLGSEATPDEFVTTLLAATREMVRVLKPSGSLWVNLGDKYATAAPGRLGATGSKTAYARDGYRSSLNMGIREKSLIGVPWRYALRCIDELGLILRAEVVWSKPNGLPESVTDRVRRSHEQWFHMVKSPQYFAAVDEIREPHMFPNQSRTKGRSMNGGTASDSDPERLHPLGKLPGSVREVPSAPLKVPAHLGVDHFAAFPPAWPAWIIRGWSPAGVCVECGEGRRPVVDKRNEVVATSTRRRSFNLPGDNGLRETGMCGTNRVDTRQDVRITGYACACPTPDAPTRPATVLDPFSGTGTVAMAARALGRHGIGVDLSMDYCRLARWRVADPGELAAVRGVERPPKQPEGQELLWA